MHDGPTSSAGSEMPKKTSSRGGMIVVTTAICGEQGIKHAARVMVDIAVLQVTVITLI